MAKEKPQDAAKANQQALASVVRQAALGDLRLLTCHASCPSTMELPGNLNQQVNVAAVLNREENSIAAIIGYSLTPQQENTETDAEPKQQSSPFIILAEFGVKYGLKSSDGISDETALLFAQHNGVFNTWSFWREFVQNMTGRMAISPLRIPLLAGPIQFAPANQAVPSDSAAPQQAKGRNRPKKK